MKRNLQSKADIADSIAQIEALTRDCEIMQQACIERQKHKDDEVQELIAESDCGSVSLATQYLSSRGVDISILLKETFPSQDELKKLGESLYGDFHRRLEKEYHDAKGCDGVDYAVAAFSGVLSGVVDVLWVGMPGDSALGVGVDSLSDKLVVGLSNLVARPKNAKGKRAATTKSVKTAIARLERVFKINYDQTSKMATGGKVALNCRNHHLLSMAHAPDWIGLIVAIINQFTDTSTFVSNGHIITIDTETFELKGHTVPAKLFSAVINWFGHIVSDFNGSSSTKRVKGGHSGAGVCPPFFELTQICGFGSIGESKQTIAQLAETIYKEGYDLRHFATCAIPVVLNELIVRFFWALRQHYQFKKPWKKCVPSANQPAVSRMLLVSYGCFCAVDAVDAAVRCDGVPLVFFLRCNLFAWYRLAKTSVWELKKYFQKERIMLELHESNMRKETQTIREKFSITDEDVKRSLADNGYSPLKNNATTVNPKNKTRFNMKYEEIKTSVVNAAQNVGSVISDAAKKSVNMWNEASIGAKIGMVACASGLSLVSIPYAFAAVAVSKEIADKFANDPELIALKNNYAALEERVKVQFAVMDKITNGEFTEDGTNAMTEKEKRLVLKNYNSAYKSYINVSEKVTSLVNELEKSGKYDVKKLHRIISLIGEADNKLQSVSAELKNYELI